MLHAARNGMAWPDIASCAVPPGLGLRTEPEPALREESTP